MIIYQRVKGLSVELYLEVEDANESKIESTSRWIGESKITELIE